MSTPEPLWLTTVNPEKCDMPRVRKLVCLAAAGTMLFQFGGCVSNVLADVFFIVGPFLL